MVEAQSGLGVQRKNGRKREPRPGFRAGVEARLSAGVAFARDEASAGEHVEDIASVSRSGIEQHDIRLRRPVRPVRGVQDLLARARIAHATFGGEEVVVLVAETLEAGVD